MSRVVRVGKYALVALGILVVLLLIVGAALSPFVVFEVRPSENLRIGVGGGTPVEEQAPAALPAVPPTHPRSRPDGGESGQPATGETTKPAGTWSDRTIRAGEIGVRVTDREGNSLAGVPVVVRRTEERAALGRELGRGETDDSGEFVLLVAPEDYVEVEADGRTLGLSIEEVWINPGRWSDVELGPAADVAVVVRTADGAPAEGWEVLVAGWDDFAGPGPRYGKTDPSGRVVIPALAIVRSEALAVSVRRPGARLSALLHRHVPERRTAQTIEVALPRMGSLHVITGQGWRTERYYMLRAELTEDEVVELGTRSDPRSLNTEVSPDELQLVVDGIPAGVWDLHVQAPETLDRVIRFKVVPETRTTIHVPVPGDPVVFSLLDHTGQKVPKGTNIEFEGPPAVHGGEPTHDWFRMEQPGVLRVRGLHPGSWRAQYLWFRAHASFEPSGAVVNFTIGRGETEKALQFPKPPPPKPAPKNPSRR
ncbi:MAG: hypothetical protein ACYTGX_17155 [Planctomycetota bacterium]|jgi:hypothetical protein